MLLALEGQPRHSQNREILTRTPRFPGLAHEASATGGTCFCRSCRNSLMCPPTKGSSRCPSRRHASRREARSSARADPCGAPPPTVTAGHGELYCRWVRVPVASPAARDWRVLTQNRANTLEYARTCERSSKRSTPAELWADRSDRFHRPV